MIGQFQGEYRWLSNFAPVTVEMGGSVYPSVEHAYQAAKTVDVGERARILEALTPGEAKRRGRYLTLRTDWDDVKVSIMKELLREKFCQALYRMRLLATGEQEIVEGNHWGDTYWGKCNGKGLNMLGQLIMQVREELRMEKEDAK